MKLTFKAIVSSKFGFKTWTLIGTSFYDYTQLVEFAPNGDTLDQKYNRNRSATAEKAVAHYIMNDSNPGWANPIAEFFIDKVEIVPTSDPDIELFTIDTNHPAWGLDGQARLGGCRMVLEIANENNDDMLLHLLKTQKSGIELIQHVDSKTSLKRFTDMNTCRVVDPGYIKLTSKHPRYAPIHYVFENSQYFHGGRVAMCAEDFKNNPRYMMNFSQLYTFTAPIIECCVKNNVPYDKMVTILDSCYESLMLPDDFRLATAKTAANTVIEHSTVFKQVFKAFAAMLKQSPESYRIRLNKMSEHANWDKDNPEILGGYMTANKKMQTGHQESQSFLFTKYMLGLKMSKKEMDTMQKAYLDANLIPNDYNKEIRINAELPQRWVDRVVVADSEGRCFSLPQTGFAATI
jgi:hypothetical protein